METKQRIRPWLLALCLILLLGAGWELRGILAPGMATASAAGPTAMPGFAAGAQTAAQLPTDSLQTQIIATYKAASPSVVNITNQSHAFNPFTGTVPQQGTGSGFIYDRQGDIVTNYHVIENADQLLVTLANGKSFSATVVGSDPANDLAVIRIDAGSDLPAPLALGDAGRLQVGQFVVAIGNPFGLEGTLTTGVVSALGRVIDSAQANGFIGQAIQTDAPINPGNSGGPLLDLSGQVIGVNSQILSPSGASAGIGFAISSTTVQRVVPELIANGTYRHPSLGADLLPLSSNVLDVLGQAGVTLPVDSGLLVLDTAPGGPAAKAGVRGGDQVLQIGFDRVPVGGDIVIAINGQPVTDLQTYTVYLETRTQVGQTVQLTVRRGAQTLTLPVTLGEQTQQ